MRAAKAKLKLRLKATVLPRVDRERAPMEDEQKTEATSEKAVLPQFQPLIVRSTNSTNASLPDSAAASGRSVGSGIFQFREARASQQTLVESNEAPGTGLFPDIRQVPFGRLASQHCLGIRNREQPDLCCNGSTWSLYCNECNVTMPNEHFHCSICHNGDYDLCVSCVKAGNLCPGEGHWLIKRSIDNGKITNSTTERVVSRRHVTTGTTSATSGQTGGGLIPPVAELEKTVAEKLCETFRTCNSCVAFLPDRDFVTCVDCEDFDLCLKCHVRNSHGHHPAHRFIATTADTAISSTALKMLSPGRNVPHNAICDGCEVMIAGVRHRCLTCPDFDLCDECVRTAASKHPRHRFAPIYHSLPNPCLNASYHLGIFCDGPLCNTGSPSPSYIKGVRYKCTVCHDTDFCAACEAHPLITHNRTHPLIKFKTPVRNVTITTHNEDAQGAPRRLGDRGREPVATKTNPTTPAAAAIKQINAATQVQTLAEIKPTGGETGASHVPEKSHSRMLALLQPSYHATLGEKGLTAHYVGDSVADGTVFAPGARFAQIFTLRNAGPDVWPAGCSVRCVGGDNMLNVDNTRPAAVSDIVEASKSNVAGRTVDVNEEVAFKVMLKAPMREGKHINYWRLKTADGLPFGHRLWCDIEVKKPVSASPSGAPIPSMQHFPANAPGPSSSPARGPESPKGIVETVNAAQQDPILTLCDLFQKYSVDAEGKGQGASVDGEGKCQGASVDGEGKGHGASVDGKGHGASVEAKGHMVYPTLEKESPESSSFQSATSAPNTVQAKAAYVENDNGEVESSAAPLPAPPSDLASALGEEGFEVLSADGDESPDDGFLTDEEYDILDASDQETVASP